MESQKFKKIEFNAGIHTCNILSPNLSQITEAEAKYLKIKGIRLPNKFSDITRCSYILNPNKTDKGKVDTYSEFEDVFGNCLHEMGIEEYDIIRCDFCIDSYQDNFNELFKINKCTILLFTLMYKMKVYESKDPLTLDYLTIRGQNKYLELENYNKKIESMGNDEAKNRLELRSKFILGNKPIPTLINEWISKLQKSTNHYEKLQIVCNKNLYERWKLEKDVEVKNPSEFFRKYQSNIFSRKQLIELMHFIGVNNPIKSAENFKYNNEIEFFTKRDLESYSTLIQDSLQKYLY